MNGSDPICCSETLRAKLRRSRKEHRFFRGRALPQAGSSLTDLFTH